MYQSKLSREAKLIVQGQQELVRDFAVFWVRLKARLGIEATKVSATNVDPY